MRDALAGARVTTSTGGYRWTPAVRGSAVERRGSAGSTRSSACQKWPCPSASGRRRDANCYLSSGGADGRMYKMTQPSRPEITVPSLLLTTTGRKSGERFICRCSRGKPSMAVSSSPRKAAHRNTPAGTATSSPTPEVDVQVGTGKKARPEPPPARSARGYRKRRSNSGRPTPSTSKTEREIPVIVLDPSAEIGRPRLSR
jgi:hypothetical protein